MTTLAAWISWDSRAPSAVYIASDSQISYYDEIKDEIVRIERNQKTFYSKNTSDIFGICGSYPVNIKTKFNTICDRISSSRSSSASINEYIDEASKLMVDYFSGLGDFVVLHGLLFNGQIQLAYYSKNKESGFMHGICSPDQGIIVKCGSGRKCLFEFERNAVGAREYKLSRCMWKIIYSSIEKSTDRFTSGPPQLVALYKNGLSHRLGVIWENQSYFGKELLIKSNFSGECRNANFERVDSLGLTIKGAQRHAHIAIPRTSTNYGG